MKAVVFSMPKTMSVDTVPDPEIKAPTDAILRVTSTAICGSDLHIYNGLLPQPKPMIMGHEFMGVVEEIGSEVRNLKKGDRVVVPFPVACGGCFFCQHGLAPHCENSNPEKYGPEGELFHQKGGALFGYTDLYGGYDGGQAEYVRVPYADVGPRKVREDFSDDQVLFLTDIFPTGYSALEWAKLQPGESVAVVGCGPVGLMAMKAAFAMGASQVIGIDIVDYRLRMANDVVGAVAIDASDGDAVEKVRALTDGRGVDVSVDAVGIEADRSMLEKLGNLVHMERGSINAFRLAVSIVRRAGRIGVVGVYGTTHDNFPWGQIFDKGLSIFTGQAHVHKYIDTLIDWVESGKITLDDIITHRLPLDQAPHAYDIFNKKEDNCVKVVLKPGATSA
jgi:S-(hydroxymethyl)glutathione dehydrogenase / alcohol dehydrogenase